MDAVLFKNLFERLSQSSLTPLTQTSPPVLNAHMEREYNKIMEATNLKSVIVTKTQENAIKGFALWLMKQIMPMQKGGMIKRNFTNIPVNQKKLDKDTVMRLYDRIEPDEIIVNREIKERERPSVVYVMTICILFAIAVYLIYESYTRGLSIAMQINMDVQENIENSEYLDILREILEDPQYINPSNGTDGGFMYSVWNSLAKGVGLSRMPTQSDTFIVTQRILEQITKDAASGLSKALIECGQVMIPLRDQYPDGVVGSFQFQNAQAIARATNIAAGTGPMQCALQITGSRGSFALTQAISDATIKSVTLLAKVSVIKTFLTFAFGILTFTVPATYALVKKAILDKDPNLMELENNPSISKVPITNRQRFLMSEISKNGIILPPTHPVAIIDEALENEMDNPRIGYGIRKFKKSRKNKRKSKQIKRNVKKTKSRR